MTEKHKGVCHLVSHVKPCELDPFDFVHVCSCMEKETNGRKFRGTDVAVTPL